MPRDDTVEPPRMVPTGQVDRLSRALRRLSLGPGFVNFLFDGCVDSEILWPSNSDDKLPHWSSMRHFMVKMTDVLPSGKWVALHDPDREERWAETDWESNSVLGEDGLLHVRGPTDLQLFDELCLAAGKAAGQMPSLEHFYIGFDGGESDWSKWADTELSYELQRARHDEPSLEIRAVPMLDPSEETIKVWRETSAKHGVAFWMRSGSSDGAVEEASRDVG